MANISRAILCAVLLLSAAGIEGCRTEPCAGEALLARESEVYAVVLGQIIAEKKGRVLSSWTLRPELDAFTDPVVPLAEPPIAELRREFAARSHPACMAPLGTIVGLKVSSGSAEGLISLTRIAFSGDWAYCQAVVAGGRWFQRQGFVLNRTPSGWKLHSVHLLELS
jgi:hypothetical protein